MISKYEKKILNELLNKYEKSKSFIGTNKVNQKFKIKVTTLFKVYKDHANYDAFDEINEAINVLKQNGYVSAKEGVGRVYNDVLLEVDNLDGIYSYLGRVPKNDINGMLEEIIKKYIDANEILNKYGTEQLQRIRENRSVQYFNDDFDDFNKVLLSIKEIMKVESEQFIREFSIKVFKDSKVFSKIQNKVENLLFEYGDFPEKDQILAGFNLVKTPTYVNYKGDAKINLSGQLIDLSKLEGDIAISSKMLDAIQEIEVIGDHVITIENLTSFHSFNEPNYFVVYLGGFHNEVRREFIKKLYQQNPDRNYFHFGDIDAGGFYILEHLKRKTGVPFKAYRMDVSTIERYKKFCKKLTVNDRTRLERLIDSEYREVVEYMLENGCKLEQEAVVEI